MKIEIGKKYSFVLDYGFWSGTVWRGHVIKKNGNWVKINCTQLFHRNSEIWINLLQVKTIWEFN